MTLSFYLNLQVQSGGYIRIQFPNSPSLMNVSSQLTNCQETQNLLQFSSCISNAKQNYIQLNLQNSITFDQNQQSSQFVVQIQNALNLPNTNISVYPVTLSTSSQEQFDITYRADVGSLQNIQINPVVNMVGADTNLNVQFTTQNIVPSQGIINLQLNQYWNQGTLSNNNIQFFSSISCNSLIVAGNQVNDSSYTCIMINDFNLQIQGAFTSGDVLGGSLIQFQLVGFKNPIQSNLSYQLFTLFTTTDDTSLFIDSSIVSYSVSQASIITDGAFSVSSTQKQMIGVVQEQNQMQIQFTSPVPLTQNCYVSYWFPTQFYDASQISSISTGAFFGTSGAIYKQGSIASNKTFIVQNEQGGTFKSITFQSCATFRDQIRETSIINGLKQPNSTQTTISLQIYIKDSVGNIASYSQSGITFTPIAGNLKLLQSSLNPNQVQNLSAMTLNLLPTHSLFTASFPSIQIYFPNSFQVQSQCQVNQSQNNQTNCQANIIQNSISIFNFLSKDLLGGQSIQIQIGQIQLPTTVNLNGQGNITIQTQLQNNISSTDQYQVDIFTSPVSSVFQINSGNFVKASVSPSSFTSNEKSDYTFQIIPYNQIPQYGFIAIQYPSDVNIEDTSLSQQMCNGWSQTFPSQQAICKIFKNNQTIIINKGFQPSSGGIGQQTLYQFVVPFFNNPSTLIQTNSFIISSYDQYFNLIDQINQNVTLQMTTPAQIMRASLYLDSYINSDITNYNFQFTPSVQINSNNIIIFTFPTDITLKNINFNYQCQSSILNNVQCVQSSQNQITISFQLAQSIAKLQTIQIQISNLQNPISTKPTDPIVLDIYDSQQSMILINQDKNSLIVNTNQPSINSKANAVLKSSVQGAGFATTFTLTLSLSQNIKQNGGIMIQYPPEVFNNPSQNVTAQVDATQYGYAVILNKPDIDLSSQQISFQTDCFQQSINLNQNYLLNRIVITINGLMNPLSGQIVNSFQVTTFNQEQNVLYLVESVVKGFTLAGFCSYPCQNCLSSSSSMCTSCYQNSPNPYLQLNTCVEKCSDGRYYDQNQQRCLPCDSDCLTCSGSSTNCLTCGNNQKNLLNINQCVQDCGNGYINDYIDHVCIPCRSGCLTCSKNVNNCTSCDQNSPTPFYFDFDCINQCPAEISIKTSSSFICQPCSSNCLTCQSNTNQCVTCQSYMKLDPLNQICLDACTPNQQIYNTITGNCDQCQKNCQTCVGDVNTCTSCKSGFVLNQDSTCQPKCLGQQNQTPINSVCSICQEPCSTCDSKINSCTSCMFSLLLYDNTCIDNCPDKFEPNNATNNQCILVGLICPDGFHVNAAGTGCIPNTFECQPGYMINSKNTACIPVPGTPVPFPFLLFAICMIVVVFGSYLKERIQTKVYTCTIFLVGSMEIVQYFCLAVISSQNGNIIAAFFSFLGLIMQIASNYIFYKRFNLTQQNDKLFTDWIRIHPIKNKIILLICLFMNFKFVRFVFSGFYGFESSLAQFSHPNMTIHNNLKMISYFQYLFVYLPIFLADFVIFAQVSWRQNQVIVIAIETFILQIFMILITQKEFQDVDKMYVPIQVHYSSLKPFQKDQNEGLISSSQLEDDGINEKQLIRYDMTTRKLEIELRKKALTQILKQVGKNFLENQTKGLDEGLEIKNVFTKFNQKEIKIRKAFSMECITNTQGILITDGTKADEFYDDENSQSDLLNSNDSRYQVLNMNKRYSYPFNKRFCVENVEDLDFKNEVNKIREAFLEDQYKDNCYAQLKVEDVVKINPSIHVRKKKMIDRRTQTYLRELLKIQGQHQIDSDIEVNMENEIEFQEDYAQGLIDNVIDQISLSSAEKNQNFKRIQRKQKQNVPEFELKDIMGEFDIDDFGNNIFLHNKDGKKVDKQNRLVNKRGYLCDEFGNVININNMIVFNIQDLDSEEDIPATYVFEKRKENFILMQENEPQVKVNEYGNGAGKVIRNKNILQIDNQFVDSDNDIVEQELKAFKHGLTKHGFSNSSEIDENQSNTRRQSLPEELFLIDDFDNIENLINKITKKVNPVKKSQLRGNSGNKKSQKSKYKKKMITNNKVANIGSDLNLEMGGKDILELVQKI